MNPLTIDQVRDREAIIRRLGAPVFGSRKEKQIQARKVGENVARRKDTNAANAAIKADRTTRRLKQSKAKAAKQPKRGWF